MNEAFNINIPEIFNTDQGRQFTSKAFTDRVLKNNILLSMDSKGRAQWIMSLLKGYGEVLSMKIFILKEYDSVRELIEGVNSYFYFYNYERPHQALG